MSQEGDTVTTHDPEGHWSHPDPAGQPPRDFLIGLGRMVIEARARIGCGADQPAVLADLKARGIEATPEQVAQFWDKTC